MPDYASGAPSGGPNNDGSCVVYSGAGGLVLRTITGDRGTNEQLGPDAVGMADTNGDGLPEIVGAAGNGNRVYIIKGNDHPTPDMNHNGVADTRDVAAFLNAWAAGDATADCNGDGRVNTQDVIGFLNRWNAGC